MRTSNPRDTRRAPASTRSLSTARRSIGACLVLAAPLALGCSSTTSASPGRDASVHDSGSVPLDAFAPDANALPQPGDFCALPGSIVSTSLGQVIIPGPDGGAPGASTMPDLSWLTVPSGFCVHYFGNVPHNRQLRFAPDGDLFAASPSFGTAGGSTDVPANGGILVLPDDDHDGYADSANLFAPAAGVQGMAFSSGNFYFQNDTNIQVIPFSPGERALPASLADASDFPIFFTLGPNVVQQDSGHWPKNLDVAQDGTLYVTNGSNQSQTCESTHPVFGSIWKTPVTGGGTPTQVAMGFRNPIALRCESNHDVCLAVELSLDGSNDMGGREKIVPVRQGDDWGFPCCATQYLPFTGSEYQDTGQLVTPSDCAGVSAENVSFEIGHTPFGIDFETGRWPAPWTNRAYLSLHGDVGTWYGSRVVAIALDESTGLPLPASELDAAATGDNLLTFASGWDDSMQDHGRATTIAFSQDGRMFIGNDWNGDVVWMAPVNLPAAWPGAADDAAAGGGH